MDEKILELNEEQLQNMAHLLLGAAWADNELHGLEQAAIDKILKSLVDDGKVPSVVTDYVDSFDPETISVADACAGLGISTDEERRAVLSLVAQVIDADFTYDFDEGYYLREVAEALGAPEDEYKGHIVQTVRLKKVTVDKD